MRRLVIAVAAMAVLLGAATNATTAAAASPVSAQVARHAILHDYWRDSARAYVLWCAPKRFGTVCGLRDYWNVRNQYGWTTGYENQTLWVSVTHGRLTVVLLWSTLHGVVGL